MSQTAGGLWNIPPPPGTESTDCETTKDTSKTTPLLNNYLSYPSLDVIRSKDSLCESIRNKDTSRHKHGISKSPSRHSRKSEDRSRNYDKRHKHKRSRSRSRNQRRRSRLNEHRHHQSSRSRSRSHNRSSSRKRYHTEKRHKHSSSKRSRSKSRSRSKHHRHRSHRSHSSRSSRSRDSDYHQNVTDSKQQSGGEDDDEDIPAKENAFKNDGSFLEMFKKMQEEQKVAEEAAKKTNVAETIDKPFIPPPFSKRRGGRVLKTGMVQKTRAITESELTDAQDAWSVYMKEVKRYKEACCDDDSKTRPLVK